MFLRAFCVVKSSGSFSVIFFNLIAQARPLDVTTATSFLDLTDSLAGSSFVTLTLSDEVP